MESEKRIRTAIAVNALEVVLEIFAIGFGIARNGLARNFIFYTEWSNLLAGIVCAACLVSELRMLRGGKTPGRTLRWAKYAASCCLLMTLFVVAFVLTPMLVSAGYNGLYLMFAEGAKSVTHFGAPLIVLISYAMFEADRDMTLRQSLVGFVPTLVYAAVAYACNIARLWDGPYPFLQVYTMPVWMSVLWFVVLFLIAFGLCQLPRLLGRKLGRPPLIGRED